MTPEDIQQIRVVVQEEISAGLDPAVEAIAAKINASEERTLEAARAMQSEILRGLEAFARGNFARMHRLDTSDADSNIRITALEERVLYLETRRPLQ
jgi:DNA helicase HerA-like ATPase